MGNAQLRSTLLLYVKGVSKKNACIFLYNIIFIVIACSKSSTKLSEN